MGHQVSTISNDEPPRRHIRTVAALAIIIALQYAAASSTQCAFASPSLQKKRQAHSSLFATASIASAIIASVPPPGSKLYQLRHDGRRPSPTSSNGRSRTDLRYATHVDSSSSCSPSSSQDDQTNHAQPLHLSTNHPNSNINLDNSTQIADTPSRHRKRRRMLKYLEGQFSRLDVKLSPTTTLRSKSNKLNNLNTNSTDYQRRKAAWAAKYTSLSTLRSTFGSNKNRFWGDFDPATTRKLYHTLIPRALLALHDMGLSNPDELAPLAYQARMAAKKYARERSRLPGRIGSMVYDGWRQWRRYGKWKFDGMTWEQIWDKYENQILKETVMVDKNGNDRLSLDGEESDGMESAVIMTEGEGLNDEDLTAKICLRILERSVVTNEMIDKLFLERLYGKREEDEDDEDADGESTADGNAQGSKRRRQEWRRKRSQQIQADLKAIEKKFDDDIRDLLRHGGLTTEEGDFRRKNRSSGSFFWSKDEPAFTDGDGSESYSTESVLTFSRGEGSDELSDDETDISEMSSVLDGNDSLSTERPNSKEPRKLAVHEVSALRILSSTKRRIANLQMAERDETSRQ
ncbi:hypothetical protein ACHAXN_009173 [Cyclotella atomus]